VRVTISWLTAFLDFPASSYDEAVAFWAKVTESSLSPTRGEYDEFATLVPEDGDAYLRVQRIGGPARIHLDLHTGDVTSFAWRMVSLGATEVARPEEGLVILRSPGGLTFCVVDEPASRRPRTWPGIVDQVCLDVNPSQFDDEAAFWAAVTMWEPRRGRGSEFEVLTRPEGLPLRLILQRLQDDRPSPVTAHLDLAAGDQIEAVVARHLELGAHRIRRTEHWETLRDPAGMEYCVTRREPKTGLLTATGVA
jgi:hypothetical protein